MNKKNILSIALVIIIAISIYSYFSGTTTTNTTSSLLAQNKTLQSPDAEYIYSLSQQLHQALLEDSIFSNPVFQSLKDNTAVFPSQPVGRNNPFAPIGTDSTFVQKSATSTTQ